MRSITRTTIFALAAAAIATPAFAAVSAYLEIGPIKGESAAKNAPAKQIEILSWSWGATNAGKYGAVSGAHRDDGVAAPAEKRQHGWMPSNRPLDRGSVRVKVKFPWLDCKVGAATYCDFFIDRVRRKRGNYRSTQSLSYLNNSARRSRRN